MLTMANPDSL